MRLQDFNYQLPQELVAQYPLKERDKARLMVINRVTGEIRHDQFANLGKYLPVQSVVVLNDSKVIPARLWGRRESGGAVEIFLLNQLADGYSHRVMISPLKRLKLDEKIIFNGGKVYAQLKDVPNRIVRFNKKNILRYLPKIGHMPLPPYIKRNDESLDREYYQTVFARHAGSVAAPTAGLHFTKELLTGLKRAGHLVGKVTLHVGDATFKPVQVDDITQHQMHSEFYRVSRNFWQSVAKAKASNKKIVAVGTTSCRTMETVALTGQLEGETNLFIYPGFSFQVVDALVTNFHLPFSTLLMLVCAFAGRDLIMRAYREAIKGKYRFYSYGDAMLVV